MLQLGYCEEKISLWMGGGGGGRKSGSFTLTLIVYIFHMDKRVGDFDLAAFVYLKPSICLVQVLKKYWDNWLLII